MTGVSSAAPPGLDLPRLRTWFAERVGRELTDALDVVLIQGGRSNLTYRVSDGADAWILRRPPLGHILATAHDMGREHRVMAALASTDVPVPRTYALCDDLSVLGAPFYVMEYVTGVAYRYRTELEPLGPVRTRAISEEMVDVLVRLHRVEPQAVGLGDFGRSDGFLSRQVSRWRHQMHASLSRPMPAESVLFDQLLSATPVESAATIVHGDYRLDNVLVDSRDRLVAVIDWEMATLGDPLTDIGLLGIYQRISDQMGSNPALADAPAAPGFLTADEVVERYRVGSGRSVDDLGFYLGLAAYKLAAILEGIHYRHVHGQTVGDGFERVGDLVAPVLDCGLAALKEYS